MPQFISTDLTFKKVRRNFAALCDEKSRSYRLGNRLTGLKDINMDIDLIALFIAIFIHYCKLLFYVFL